MRNFKQEALDARAAYLEALAQPFDDEDDAEAYRKFYENVSAALRLSEAAETIYLNVRRRELKEKEKK